MIDSSHKLISGLVLISVICSSCGFHLRGSQPQLSSEVNSLYIFEDESTPVGDEIRTLMEISGTEITPESNLANYRLYLSDHNIEQTVLSVSASTGKAEEYQLQITIRMTLTDSDQKELINNQLIRITRDYAFDDTAVLGSVSERDVLIEEMTKLAASQIVRILNSIIS